MSLNLSNIYHQLPLSPPIIYGRILPIRDRHCTWKRRRRLKLNGPPLFRCQLSLTSFDAVYHKVISQIPSLNINSLQTLAPALGLASGIALYLSQSDSKKSAPEIGEWILFTSRTPFNRFVILRCPSITFEGSELSEDVNERLVKEERHFVRLNSGRIHVREVENSDEKKLVYQRVCIGMGKVGGVISVDWPANLDLEDERGFDTTMVIVPGTTEGSMERSIREFVCDCLRRGCFPVVMNPRGCAGSPLTTARLFTAADSDDVSTAIEFIRKARPWTTLMAVGWGYGANMLTKYLAEVGEKTPLTAATCINNPFDLEEATRSSPHHTPFNQKLAGGLIDILRSNKELFQGRAKGFDVEKALLSSSVRDFEEAISMVSYGFDALEDFYEKSSTRHVVGKVKIPVLFIQNDDGSVPLFSVPRSLIAENPFTSLLICSCLPSSNLSGARSTLSWCQNVTIEWLTAVELGLLKGRHPLLKDVDVTVNPSNGFALVDGRASSSKDGGGNKLMNFLKSDASNGHSLDSLRKMLEDNDTVASSYTGSSSDLNGVPQFRMKGLRQGNNNLLQHGNAVDAEVVKEDGVNPVDSDRGQVLQTAEVVMNMLDATMPDTLTKEQKEKVLTAVGQGESLMKALQDAVPEDVRGKLTNALSGILHSQSSNLKLDGLLHLGDVPDVASRLKSKVQEKVELSNKEDGNNHSHSSGQRTKYDDHADASMNQPTTAKPSDGLESELQASESLYKSSNTDHFQLQTSDGSDAHALEKEIDVLGNNGGLDDRQKYVQHSDSKDHGPETGFKHGSSYQSEGEVETHASSIDRYKATPDDGRNQQDMKEENANQQKEEKIADSSADKNKTTVSTQMEEKSSHPQSYSEAQLMDEENAGKQKEEKVADSSADKNKTISSTQMEDKSSHPSSSSVAPLMDKEAGEDQKKDENNTQPIQNQNSSSSPSFSVSQAFDALTLIDDSTQVAVNSVFQVIENMITQLADESDNKTEDKDKGNAEDQKIVPAPQEHTELNRPKMEGSRKMPSNHVDDISSYNQLDSDERSTSDPVKSDENGGNISQEFTTKDNIGEEFGRRGHIIYGKQAPEKSVKYLNRISLDSLLISPNVYGNPLSKKNLQGYLSSNIRSTKSLDLDSTTALFLEYFPEEGQWKLLDKAENERSSTDIATDETWSPIPSKAKETDNIIEPSYVVLDARRQEADGEYELMDELDINDDVNDNAFGRSMLSLKTVILETLKIEVARRLSAIDMQEMESRLSRDINHVANSVYLALGNEDFMSSMKDLNNSSDGVGLLQGEHITSAIKSAVVDTDYLRRVLPVGVIVGSCLAAVRKYANVAAKNRNAQIEDVQINEVRSRIHNENDKVLSEGVDNNYGMHRSDIIHGEKNMNNSNGNAAMVGAVTAALGASALLVHQQDTENTGASGQPFKENEGCHKEPSKAEEDVCDKIHNNIVTSLAEKAMSVAGPVVPTKDGEVDQEKLVAMLAELGQRGGLLRLVGKVALLWGGIRGAMSLTDKLIAFLRIAERPLYQRILGFICMVLVLWSPVVIPLLPTLVQSWTAHSSSRIAELSCVIGLYVSILILITLWGRRIRGYEKPLEQYGLYLNSFTKVDFLKGLIGGIILVLVIQSLNWTLGCVNLHWPPSLPSSSLGVVALLKFYGQMVLLIARGFATATGVSIVEELLFRSWLPDEIAIDLGYHRGIIISGLVFSLSQRSALGIPGLWLLSLALAGARERCEGSLWLPVGLRAGILACSFILQRGAFLTYQPNFPLWLTGTHPFQPFSGLTGLTFSLLLAIILYPRQPRSGKKLSETIRE